MKQEKLPLAIAIVDDDESVLDAVKTVLDDELWNTRTYTRGEAFLSDLNLNTPDCIILDAYLSGLSGVAVAKAINESQFDIPIIVLTAYPDSSKTKELRELGAHCVLAKPVSAGILIKKIQEAVNPAKTPC